MDKVYTCPRCRYETKNRCHIIRHYSRKKPCEPTYSDITTSNLMLNLNDEIQAELSAKHFCCDVCSRKFSSNTSLKLHIKNFHPSTSAPTLRAQENSSTPRLNETPHNTEVVVDKLMSMIEMLANKTNNIQQQNNININNIVVNQPAQTRRDFGEERVDYISEEFIKEAIANLNEGFVDMVNKIHYDPEVPENNNIAFKSSKQKQFWVMRNGTWQVAPHDDVVRQMFRKIGSMMYNRYLDGVATEDADLVHIGDTYHNWHVDIAQGKGANYWNLKNKVVCNVQNQTLHHNPVLQDLPHQPLLTTN